MTLRGGIDLGGTKIEALVVDEANEVQGRARQPTPADGGAKALARALAATLREAAEDAGTDAAGLAGVGVGTPGNVDMERGTVGGSGNVAALAETVPLADLLGTELGVPVRLGNDVRAAVEAERLLGAGRHYASFLGVWWGTGIGGGVVLDGKLWLGHGSAGEIGHMVIRDGGARCPCGRRGCLEAYAGRGAMERRARRAEQRGEPTKLFELMREKGRTRLTSGVWEDALERGDKLARTLIDTAVVALGAAVGSVQNLLDLDAIVIGGGLGTRFGQPYVERIAAAAEPHLFVPERPPAFVPTELGDLGGALGAALLVS